MQNDQFVRYKALDRCFRNPLGGYTIEDLMKECSRAVSIAHREDRVVSRRTIEKDLEDLKLRFDIEFRNGYKDGKKKLYQYADTSYSLMKDLLADGELEKQLLQNVIDMLQCYEDVPQYKWLLTFLHERVSGITCNVEAVSFQSNPDLLGIEYFSVLMDAIVKKQVITFQYHPYGREARLQTIHPYQLKQFNDRWFLIGKSEGYGTINNLALDRIEGEIEKTELPYVECSLSLSEYYDEVIGVTVHPEEPTERILLRVSNHRYPYIATKPIHGSQKEIHAMADENSHVLSLQLKINNELEAKILSFGNDMEVLEPASLRDSIKQRITDLFNKYK